MILQILCVVLLVIFIIGLIIVLIRQHHLKQLQKQNQAIDYIIQRMKNATNDKRSAERLNELINIIKEK